MQGVKCGGEGVKSEKLSTTKMATISYEMKREEKCTLVHRETDLNLCCHGNTVEGIDVGLDASSAEEEFC